MTVPYPASPDDQPGGEPTYELAVPFKLCASQGGPYPDDAFVAGVEVGSVDARMKAVVDAGGTGIIVTVRTDHVEQLELHAMHRGLPNLDRTDHDGVHAGWSTVSFMADPGDDLL